LGFLGFRKKREAWGTVYDSKTKLPLDPVMMELIDAETGRVVEKAITDIPGRYGFLVRPGKFVIKAAKTNYLFPSRQETGEEDEIYNKLYHGEILAINSESDVLAPNIPMDPLRQDWNEQEKKRMFRRHPRLKNAFLVLLNTLFWAGLVFAVVSYLAMGTIAQLVFLVFYIILVLAAFLAPASRLWGRLAEEVTRRPLGGYLLELSFPQAAAIIVSRARSGPDGKFFLKANPGRYLLTIKSPAEGRPQPPAAVSIEVDKTGLVNKDILL
jgi:hypothetical protein